MVFRLSPERESGLEIGIAESSEPMALEAVEGEVTRAGGAARRAKV